MNVSAGARGVFSESGRGQRRLRRPENRALASAAAVAVAVPLATVTQLAHATPAAAESHADTVAPLSAPTVVHTIDELEDALDACEAAPLTIAPGAEIAAAGEQIDIECDVTLDLASSELSLRNIVIEPDNELTVTGDDEGSLKIDVTAAVDAAGIQTAEATLRITGGSVEATGNGRGH